MTLAAPAQTLHPNIGDILSKAASLAPSVQLAGISTEDCPPTPDYETSGRDPGDLLSFMMPTARHRLP